MSASLTVAGLHLAPARGDRQSDLAAAAKTVEAAVAEGARLVVLPELFGWPCFTGDDPSRWRHAAEPLDGPTAVWAAALADRLATILLVPLVLAEKDAAFNAVVLIGPGRAPCVVARKMHLPPPLPGDAFGEADHFRAGPPVVGCCDPEGMRVAVLVCFDRRFPESWRAARGAGADLVVCPVAGPADEPPDFFLCELRTHARENGVYALTAGRSGSETVAGRTVHHMAPTALVGPDGSVLDFRASTDPAGAVIHTVTTDHLHRLRAQASLFERRRQPTGVVLC